MIQQLAAGIDIGGTNTAYGLVDREGNILMKDTITTGNFSTAEEFVSAMEIVIRKALSSLGSSYSLAGIGIGAPNGNYYKGTIEFPPNLKWKGITPLAKYFEEKFDVKTVLTNDANAGAIGEMLFGGAKNMKDFIYITLGTGLGSGIVVNGELVYGHDGFAGELGHVVMFPDGRVCGCGRYGCLEAYCSATGIKRTYIEKRWRKEKMNDGLKDIHTKDIYDKAVAGDEDALSAFEYTGEILGFALANSVLYTSPEAIFLFGGVALAGDFIFKPTIASFEKYLYPIFKGKIKILSSKLMENEAAVLGAASLIWKELDKKSVSSNPILKSVL